MSVEMNVAVGEGVRRFPVYLLLDCSGSMSGAPIAALQHGVEQFQQEIAADEFARQSACIAVITFDSGARMVTPGLVEIDKFQPPTLTASGSTSLGAAFQVLQQSLNTDIKSPVRGGEKGDYKPLVFILTDGGPTDEWRTPRQMVADRQKQKVLNVITVGCGNGIDETTLKAIAIGPAFRMDDSSASFAKFFKWVSQSVSTLSKSFQSSPGEQPIAFAAPDPQYIQYLP